MNLFEILCLIVCANEESLGSVLVIFVNHESSLQKIIIQEMPMMPETLVWNIKAAVRDDMWNIKAAVRDDNW